MKSFEEKTSAVPIVIAFDYQYYYFLLRLIQLKRGEKITYEVKDDIHIELSNKNQILLQLKHTIKKDTNAETINLTELDNDLWKTISNWVEITNAPVKLRDKSKEQHKYITKTEYVLVSNKKQHKSNSFFKILSNYQAENDFSGINTYLTNLEKKTSDTEIKKYINNLNIQSDKWKKAFLYKIKFDLSTDDLIYKIKEEIQYSSRIRANKVDDIFNCLFSETKLHSYFSGKSGSEIEITFEDFYKKYQPCFDKGRSEKLTTNQYKVRELLPDKLENQTFIKQLLEIKDITPADFDEILEFSYQKIYTQNNKKTWHQNNLITETEIENFDKSSIIYWKNSFREAHQNDAEDFESEKKNARQCINQLRKQELHIQKELQDIEFSNGQFYLLSDIPKIGWLKNWKKYEK